MVENLYRHPRAIQSALEYVDAKWALHVLNGLDRREGITSGFDYEWREGERRDNDDAGWEARYYVFNKYGTIAFSYSLLIPGSWEATELKRPRAIKKVDAEIRASVVKAEKRYDDQFPGRARLRNE